MAGTQLPTDDFFRQFQRVGLERKASQFEASLDSLPKPGEPGHDLKEFECTVRELRRVVTELLIAGEIDEVMARVVWTHLLAQVDGELEVPHPEDAMMVARGVSAQPA